MHASVVALLGYVIWMLVLLSMIGYLRVSLTLAGKHAPNNFLPDGSDVSAFSNRLCRAHANCYESFPIYGGLLLLAIATDATAVTDGLAYYFIAARVLQSVSHLASTSNSAVRIRFALFLTQIIIAIWWAVHFFQI